MQLFIMLISVLVLYELTAWVSRKPWFDPTVEEDARLHRLRHLNRQGDKD